MNFQNNFLETSQNRKNRIDVSILNLPPLYQTVLNQSVKRDACHIMVRWILWYVYVCCGLCNNSDFSTDKSVPLACNENQMLFTANSLGRLAHAAQEPLLISAVSRFVSDKGLSSVQVMSQKHQTCNVRKVWRRAYRRKIVRDQFYIRLHRVLVVSKRFTNISHFNRLTETLNIVRGGASRIDNNCYYCTYMWLM